MKKTKKTALKQWFWAFIIALVLAMVCRMFIIQSFVVSNSRMEKTLLTGDFIFVEKLSYGGRLPITPFSIPFTGVYMDALHLPYIRIPGTKQIKVNDIIVFNYPVFTDQPIDKRDIQVKRCMALTGDTIEIKNKQVFVNHHEVSFPTEAQLKYRIVTHKKEISQDFIDKYNITEGGLVSDIGIYDFPMKRSVADSLLNDSLVKFIRELKDFQGDNASGIFPQSRFFTWNKDYFGPLVVPAKGLTIKLDLKNIELYKSTISVHENKLVEIRNSLIYIDGNPSSAFTFSKDYYFVMDDNRDFAKDSRHWGFVPASHIVGKACCIWFSVDRNRKKIRWNRIFRVPK